jgi:hypothetical protein
MGTYDVGMRASTLSRLTHPLHARVDHRDGAGHLDAAYEARLRANARGTAQKNTDKGFAHGTDAAAREWGKEFVMSVTSAEDGGDHVIDEDTPEDIGGPFVSSSSKEEFAYDSDASNPVDATREPFPTSSARRS